MRVVLVGGIGHLACHYRRAAGALGIELSCVERAPGRLPRQACPDAIVVITGICSHKLLARAMLLASAARCPIRYLKTASLSAVRTALLGLAEPVRTGQGD